MNEGNRGQKGGLNDRRRVIKLRKKELERLKELNEEESLKKVLKENESKELLSIIPIVIIKIMIDNIKSNNKVYIDRDKKEQQKETLDKTSNKQIDVKPTEEKEEYIKVEKIEEDKKEEDKKEAPIIEDIILPGILLIEGSPKVAKVEKKEQVTKKETKEEKKLDTIEVLEEKESKEKELEPEQLKEKETKEQAKEEVDLEDKQSEIDKKIEKLSSNKIVEKYMDKLMDIRYDLRNLIFEYNVIRDRKDKLETKDEAERLLDSLNLLIKKIDELKKKLEIPNNDKYDETYLYAIAEEYMKEFSNNNPIKEIKSSPLYISISDKVKELDKAKDKLKKNLDDKKKNLGIKEDKVEKLKSKYDDISNFDKKMEDFTTQADKELKDIEEKVRDSLDIRREMEYRVVETNRMSRILAGLIAVEAMLPTNRSAKRAALIATVGAYILNRMLNRRIEVRENVHVSVKDYSERIEKDLDKIEDVQKTLSNSSKDIDKIISLLENDYKDVVAANSEYKELLVNLKIIKANLQEKEYELRKINDETKKTLDENNQKVLRYN